VNSDHPHGQPPGHGRDHSPGDGDGEGQGREHGHAHGWKGRLQHLLTPHAHDHSEAIQTAEESSAYGIRAAWIGLAGMGATAVMQIVIVAISGSIALLADTLHNVGHLATTIPLIIAFKLGRRPATRRYSYGFRRSEDLVGLLISAVIALSAVLIIWESVRALQDPRPLTNLGWVFAAGLVGAAGNELVAVYRMRAGRRIGSAALVAEGQHARTDGLTSLAVVVGVTGAWLGFPELDAIIGLVIAAVILWILVNSTRVVIRRLMDGVDEGTLDAIEDVARAIPGVQSVDRARARWGGHRLEAEIDIAVDRALTVEAGHAIAEATHHELLHQVAHLDHVSVHLNPAGIPGAHTLTGHHSSAEARREYLDQRGRAGR
jgi:cation diffusion facilitator family transporter